MAPFRGVWWQIGDDNVLARVQSSCVAAAAHQLNARSMLSLGSADTSCVDAIGGGGRTVCREGGVWGLRIMLGGSGLPHGQCKGLWKPCSQAAVGLAAENVEQAPAAAVQGLVSTGTRSTSLPGTPACAQDCPQDRAAHSGLEHSSRHGINAP